jgi:hypothetical protein
MAVATVPMVPVAVIGIRYRFTPLSPVVPEPPVFPITQRFPAVPVAEL